MGAAGAAAAGGDVAAGGRWRDHRQGLKASCSGPAPLHTIGDGRGPRNLATRLTFGQDADTRQLIGLVDAVRVARPGGRGRPGTRVPI